MRNYIVIFWFALSVSLWGVQESNAQTPVIASFSPTSAKPGDIVTI